MTLFAPAPPGAPLSERLGAFPLAARLGGPARERLAAAASPVAAPRGQRVMAQGQACDALVLVESGAIRVYKTSPAGRQITLYQVAPGESCLLGTNCVLSRGPYPAEAEVAAELRGLAVPAPLFRDLFRSDDAVRQFVLDLFARRLAGLMLLVDEVAFRRMDERLARFLVSAARPAPGVLRPGTMSHEQIALHLGTAREVVSRLLAQFGGEALVSLKRNQVAVRDPDGLEKRAGPPPE